MAKLTEEDIKLRYITPAIQQAGWDRTQFRMEYFFTDGQVLVRGKVVLECPPKMYPTLNRV